LSGQTREKEYQKETDKMSQRKDKNDNCYKCTGNFSEMIPLSTRVDVEKVTCWEMMGSKEIRTGNVVLYFHKLC
jgi:hypothetical protein